MVDVQIKLTKKIKNPNVIIGFPGFGLVGTITTEFLIDHLKTEQIGKMWFEEMAAIAAIHDSRLIYPISVHYNKDYNIAMVHGVTPTVGMEWKITDLLMKFIEMVDAKSIISIEGIGSLQPIENPKVHYFSTNRKHIDGLKNAGLEPLKEGIIMGVSGALLLKMEKRDLTCIFAETQSNMPDSRAASSVISALDKLMGLKVDPKPLIEQALRFEEKLKKVMESGQQLSMEQKKKTLSYMG